MIKTRIFKLALLGLISTSLAFVAFQVSAADTAKPAEEATAAPKPKTIPFRGKLEEVDKVKMTIKVGTRTFNITSETKITRDGKPAILSDGVLGDTVGGAYKTGDDGKLTATTVNLTSAAAPSK